MSRPVEGMLGEMRKHFNDLWYLRDPWNFYFEDEDELAAFFLRKIKGKDFEGFELSVCLKVTKLTFYQEMNRGWIFAPPSQVNCCMFDTFGLWCKHMGKRVSVPLYQRNSSPLIAEYAHVYDKITVLITCQLHRKFAFFIAPLSFKHRRFTSSVATRIKN